MLYANRDMTLSQLVEAPTEQCIQYHHRILQDQRIGSPDMSRRIACGYLRQALFSYPPIMVVVVTELRIFRQRTIPHMLHSCRHKHLD